MSLAEFPARVRDFAFIKGEQPVHLDPEDPANLKATQLLADLHDALAQSGFTGHALERVLVRILFCLFAEDSGIFDEPAGFTALIERTSEDGADLGLWLAQLFQVLNTPEGERQRNLDEDLAAFPYVNGALFAEQLPFVSFNSSHRKALLACTRFHWARISPAVFGSLFQGVLDKRERRQSGAHYTSERDIMKVIRSLFLDELRAELDAALADRSTRRIERLREFQKKLRRLRFFDPACGCGNFLILAYREIRKLEQEALVAIHTVKGGQIAQALDVSQLSIVDVDQFYGLEIAEWPVRIAEVGLWLADHQANQELAAALGQSFRRLPLTASPTLRVANALRTDWREFLPPTNDVYVLGNPPFVGKHYQTKEQRADLHHILSGFGNVGDLDYVTGWFIKAGDYIQNTRIQCSFVATNSITQGEQVPVVWGLLFSRYHLKIHFAHRTFRWMSEAKGKAHVHVVIIGFGAFDVPSKTIYDYDGGDDAATSTTVANISPYLAPGPDTFVVKRSKPPEGVPPMRCGNKPSDGGHLILSDEERTALLAAEPGAGQFVRRYMGSEEFINGGVRWCLWLKDADPRTVRSLPSITRRIEAVRTFRQASTAKPTQVAAARPAEFFYISQPDAPFIAVPEVSSERRRYVPIGYLPPSVIPSNKLYVVASPSLFLFGVLSSAMHMAWIRIVSGRLKSDFQYSGTVVYNTFPWPTETAEKDRSDVEAAAQALLDARAVYPDAALADLYDPLTMPTQLVKTHAALDRAVDRCYRREPFRSERERVEHLFALYEKLAAPLLPMKERFKARSRRKK